MILFLAVLALLSAFFYGFGIKALLPVIIAVITTTTLDFLIEYFKSKKNKKNRMSNSTFSSYIFFPQSALISGLFIGGLLTQNLQWHVYIFAGAIAILSKHLIKARQRHIFNPANLGVLLASIIFGAAHTWWISSPLILVMLFGLFILWRLRRLDLSISFLLSYYLIISALGMIKGSGLSEIYYAIMHGGVIYFFSMFMLIEPKTHPSAGRQRIVYGILVAVLFVAFNFYVPKYDLPLALAVGNLFVPVLNSLKKKKI